MNNEAHNMTSDEKEVTIELINKRVQRLFEAAEDKNYESLLIPTNGMSMTSFLNKVSFSDIPEVVAFFDIQEIKDLIAEVGSDMSEFDFDTDALDALELKIVKANAEVYFEKMTSGDSNYMEKQNGYNALQSIFKAIEDNDWKVDIDFDLADVEVTFENLSKTQCRISRDYVFSTINKVQNSGKKTADILTVSESIKTSKHIKDICVITQFFGEKTKKSPSAIASDMFQINDFMFQKMNDFGIDLLTQLKNAIND